MNIKVMYHTKTGNTKKVAEAIAEAVGTLEEPISENNNFDITDILFTGDGVYKGKMNAKTENFIKSLNADKIKNVAVFGTFGGQNKAINGMKELLEKQGIKLVDKSFGCKGRAWIIMNRNHPVEQDLKDAKEFASNIVKEINN